MEYEKISLTSNKDCNCKAVKKDCNCSKKANNKIELTSNCGTSESFLVSNYFSELVHEWEKEAARYNLGVLELDEIEYVTEATEDGELLNKVIFKYRKGHELISREFVCAPRGEKGEKGEKGDRGRDGYDGAKGEKGDKGDSPTMGRVILTWVDNNSKEDCYFEPTCDNNQWNLILNLHKPDSITELGNILNLINQNLVDNYVAKGSLPDFSDFVKKSENALRLDYTGSTLSLLKNGILENSVKIEIPESQNYVLPTANDLVLGGVRTGYKEDASAKHYPVCVDGSGRAYVKVPWTDTVTDDFDINNWKTIIKKWLGDAVRSLEDSLNHVEADITKLNKWKINVTDDDGNVKSTFVLSDEQIIAAIENNGVLAGIVSDTLKKENCIVLKEGENGAYFLLKLDEDNSSVTAISSKNIILDGNTIAESIQAEDISLGGKLIAFDAEIQGTINANNLLFDLENNNVIFTDKDYILPWPGNNYKLVFFTATADNLILSAKSTTLRYSLNENEHTINSFKPVKDVTYLLIHIPNKYWKVLELNFANFNVSGEQITETTYEDKDVLFYKGEIVNLSPGSFIVSIEPTNISASELKNYDIVVEPITVGWKALYDAYYYNDERYGLTFISSLDFTLRSPSAWNVDGDSIKLEYKFSPVYYDNAVRELNKEVVGGRITKGPSFELYCYNNPTFQGDIYSVSSYLKVKYKKPTTSSQHIEELKPEENTNILPNGTIISTSNNTVLGYYDSEAGIVTNCTKRAIKIEIDNKLYTVPVGFEQYLTDLSESDNGGDIQH